MNAAKKCGDTYRALYGQPPLKTEIREGVEHLVPGQHFARWVDIDMTVAELSYVGVTGHAFIIVFIDGETREPTTIDDRVLAIVAELGAARQTLLSPEWEMSDEMRAAVEQAQ